MKITLSCGSTRPKPKTGDTRTTKAHGLQIRVPLHVHNIRGEPIGYDCTGGKQRYEWRKPETLKGTRYEYLLRRPDIAKLMGGL